MNKIKVGIIGGAGYTAGELIRILINHPNVSLQQVQSESQVGKVISEVHTDLIGETSLRFVPAIISKELDVVFLCKGHGASAQILENDKSLFQTKLIDLSQDFRLKRSTHDFVYGLPEFNRSTITKSQYVANPGCFATCIQLGLLPAVVEGIVAGNIHISGITGSTGAGQSLSATSHFSWRNSNASVYKPFTHQHLLEIGETLTEIDDGFESEINFIPYRGAFTRGIIITTYFDCDVDNESLLSIYQRYYEQHPFTHVSETNPDLKMVVNTNKCVVYPKKIGDKAMVISVIDNLLKGASGQAVQNMNLQFGLEEQTGLNLKSTSF
ncbi:MAG: N-acetyl-gamma-glutamyl-phosphate reductase [Cyclobacteriaceae bacterium]|nr:N-acetyl-gamma-glutamyl-phosphate reductase [Cyclobacteriaceae bacterium HetDA_MAG_MS6]